MLSQRRMKEEAADIRDRLKRELGEKGFEQLFEEAKKSLIQEAGPWPQPSFEEIVMTMGYMLEEKKRRKAFDQKRARQKKALSGLEEFNVIISHDGDCWRIYYYETSNFVYDLATFGKFLEAIKERGKTVSSIIPNIGWVKLATLEGIKGFAVITRKTEKQ